VLTVALLHCGGSAFAEDAPITPSTPTESVQMVKDEQALNLLKVMSDTLTNAKTLSFKARSLVPIEAPNGQLVSMFGNSRVVMQRPDKLFVESRGDLFPNDLYYNGKTVTAIGLQKKFYVQREAENPTLDDAILDANPGSDTLAPFVEMLVSDPYTLLTQYVLSAMVVGQSTIDGVKTDHLAFTAKGVDWEIWIGTQDKLPRLMVVSYREGERQPTFTVVFSNWKLNAPVPAHTFNAVIPKGAVKLDFKLNSLPTSTQ
jgi:hypothetical protein